MNVSKYILERLDEGEKLLFVVIDPEDHPSMDHIEKVARMAEEHGGDALVVGGSTGVQGDLLEETLARVKEVTSLPVILFPGNVGTISRKADAIYFMSLLNSKNVYWITRAQIAAAPIILKYNVEALPTAYLVFEPGGTVGYIGQADLIPRNKPKIAIAYSLAAALMGFQFLLMDSGSNAPEPIPADTIRATKEALNKAHKKIPLIVAGGIKSLDQARKLVKAGADILHVGTMFEKKPELIKSFVQVIKT